MKNFFRFLMAAAVLSSASVSCSNDDPEDVPIPPKEAVQTEAISPPKVCRCMLRISPTAIS